MMSTSNVDLYSTLHLSGLLVSSSKMTSEGSGVAAAPPSQWSTLECCMCGDHGFIRDLFLCKLCRFRSQHRYCSNLYPTSESYSICNWCLSPKEEPKEKSSNSSNSSFHHPQHHTQQSNNIHGGFKGPRSDFQSHFRKPPNQSSSPEKPSSSSGWKRIAGDLVPAKKQRRTKNEDHKPKRNRVIKQVFRHKARRYKLLDEVAT